MRLKRTALSLAGYALLGLALLATVSGLSFVVRWLVGVSSAPATTMAFAAMVNRGVALVSGLFGVFLRKAVAGTVLPLDVDNDRWRAVLSRGGQG